MGISSLVNRVPYNGDGSTTAFAFSYYFTSQADLLVYKYDTILGGIVAQVLNTHYTISGSTNAQGIYTTGGTVNMVTAPLSTDILIIIRSPSEVQNFALLQNGPVSSTALVQQLDYLTILIQRLEDQVSRCVQLPDGLGPTFSTQLPSNSALNPGSFFQVNALGTGLQLTTSPLFNFSKASFDYTSFQTASTTNSVAAFSLPAGCMLTGLVIKHSSAFTGGSITAVVAQLGISGTAGKFINSFDIFQAPGNTTLSSVLTGYIYSWVSAQNILLTLTSTTANLSQLTQGHVDVFYSYVLV